MGFPDERYRIAAQQRGLTDMIRFTGKVDYKEAPLLLSAADFAITPKLSPTEANGKIFNYMACGLPVVAFDTVINREILGDTGVYVTYGDARDLAAKITSLSNDRPSIQQLSQRVYAKALNDHSWNSRGKELVNVYNSMLRHNQ